MAFHIDVTGEAAHCEALSLCPFGDFDTEHFTTKELAQAAAQAIIKGKNTVQFSTEKKHLELLALEQKVQAKKDAASLKELQKYKRPLTVVPTFDLALGFDPEDSEKILYREATQEEREIQAALSFEKTLEDSALNFIKSYRSFDEYFSFNFSYAKTHLRYNRIFKRHVKKFMRSGVSLPYTRAYNATIKIDLSYDEVVGEPQKSRGLSIFRSVMEQDSNRLDLVERACIENCYFPGGKIPFSSIDFQELSEKRKLAGLM